MVEKNNSTDALIQKTMQMAKKKKMSPLDKKLPSEIEGTNSIPSNSSLNSLKHISSNDDLEVQTKQSKTTVVETKASGSDLKKPMSVTVRKSVQDELKAKGKTEYPYMSFSQYVEFALVTFLNTNK